MNVKSIFLATSLLLIIEMYSIPLKSQNFEWVKGFGGSDRELGGSIIEDASGNIYTTGYFTDSVDFDPGPGTAILISEGERDVFVQKMDASGNFLWAKAFGGIKLDNGKSVAVDASGNVYTVGLFMETVDFDPGPDTAILSAVGSQDVFVQKMDASGDFLWVKAFGGSMIDIGSSITVDASSNIYTVGEFIETVDFDPGTDTANLSAVGDRDVFVHKMDAAGNFLWARTFGGINRDVGTSIALDASGNIYTTGSFQDTVDFDPGAGVNNLSTSGSRDAFVQKMDAAGNFLWAKVFGGTSFDAANSITIDASGNVFTTGYFLGTVDFDPGADTVNLSSAGSRDIFVLKLDANGNYIWAKVFGGSNSDGGESITLDASGNIYTTGHFLDTADFDPGVDIANLSSAGSRDVFVQKMDAAGNFLWAKAFGSIDSDFGISITVDAFGNIYTLGSFEDTVDFDPGPSSTRLFAEGGSDIFVLKMGQQPTGLPDFGDGIRVAAYPNPSSGIVQLSFEQPLPNVDITLTDLQGRVVYTHQLDGVSTEPIAIEGPPGIYFLHLQTPRGQSVVKVVKQ